MLYSEKMLGMISIFYFFNFTETWFVTQNVILEKVLCALEKEVYSAAFGWNIL